MHQPASSFYEGPSPECIMDIDEIVIMQNTIADIYSQRTGKPSWQIHQDMHRNFFMSAQDAYDYGIIDDIAGS